MGLDDSLAIAKLYQNKGAIFQYLGQAEFALEAYNEAGSIFKLLGNMNGEVDIIINQAAIYQMRGEYKSALLALQSAKSSLKKFFLSGFSSVMMTFIQLNNFRYSISNYPLTSLNSITSSTL